MLEESTAHAWEIFTVLNRTRITNETGPQPITIQEFASYCSLFDISDTGIVDDLLYYVTELDKAWLKVTHEKIQVEREKAREKSARRR